MESLRVGISYSGMSILGKHALAELVARRFQLHAKNFGSPCEHVWKESHDIGKRDKHGHDEQIHDDKPKHTAEDLRQ